MSHRADGSRAHRAHPHALRKKCREHLLRVHGAVQLEDHDIGFDGRWVKHDTWQFAQTFSETPRISMVLGKPADVVTQRINAARGDDPRLTHRPAHLLLEAPSLCDEFTRTGERCSDRGAEPFAEVDPG